MAEVAVVEAHNEFNSTQAARGLGLSYAGPGPGIADDDWLLGADEANEDDSVQAAAEGERRELSSRVGAGSELSAGEAAGLGSISSRLF